LYFAIFAISQLQPKLLNKIDPRPDFLSDKKLHLLKRDRTGQAAFDIPDANGNRGPVRVLADVGSDGKLQFSSLSENHYKGAPPPGKVNYQVTILHLSHHFRNLYEILFINYFIFR
jgi:hypothetical protein